MQKSTTVLPHPAATRGTYAGLFLVTLSTLMLEILLTRIFSVTMWYHFAFVAISLAMFGMTAGALVVYVGRARFAPEQARQQLAKTALLYAVSVLASFWAHLYVPVVTHQPMLEPSSLALIFVLMVVPFTLSGVCVCLALTRFPAQISRLYAADLAGAASGCVLLVLLLRATDGPSAVAAVAALGALGACCFAAEAGCRGLRMACAVCTAALGGFSMVNSRMALRQAAPLHLTQVKFDRETRPLHEKWNSFSRIRVDGDVNALVQPLSSSLSPLYPKDRLIHQLFLSIDANAGTPLTRYQGDPAQIDHFKYDATNMVHYLRPDSNVLVVGVGGGRDVLSALAFKQRSVTGVEINGDILDIDNRLYGDFTGHLDRNPKVRLVNDEARSYLTRSHDRFDILEVSLIDTWAATAAGAFVLSENSLYTLEAWQVFLNRLTPRGVLSFSRWYYKDRPVEMYRLVALATEALLSRGVKDPRAHMLIVRHMNRSGSIVEPDGIGTLLVSPTPFSDADIGAMERTTQLLKFDLVLSPRACLDPAFASLTSAAAVHPFVAAYPALITAPTDDSPFFFHMLRLRDVFHPGKAEMGVTTFNTHAVATLGWLLLIVFGLTAVCILGPLLLTVRQVPLAGTAPLFAYFSAIGLGFVLIEVSQMQRLVVFLGHPTYGLSVVLFALLLSSGLGSFLTQGVGTGALASRGLRWLVGLVLVLLVFGAGTPLLTSQFAGSTTPLRIAMAVAILFPQGVLMGTAFPLGMRLTAERSAALTPWLWGVNGALSVCASVLSVIIALNWGISASFWCGFACYAVALAAFAATARASMPTARAAKHLRKSEGTG